jgi:rod shape-determining protein MreC
MYRKQVRRRRAVLVALIVISLVLLSSHFSEAQSGPLHTIQRGISAVLAPVGEGAERALKPARDLVNWVDETFAARGENEELKDQVAELRQRAAAAQVDEGKLSEYEKLLEVDRGAAVGGYDPVTARVIGRSPTVWFATVTIDHGKSSGIEKNDAVITGDGLVGRIRDLTAGTAQIELITDPDNAVSAKVLPDGPSGVLSPVAGDPKDLLLDFISGDQPIDEGETLVTAGWSNGQISSAYPPEIPIGEISSAEAGEQEQFQRIHVEPYVDLRELDFVQVLTGGPERPGVPG